MFTGNAHIPGGQPSRTCAQDSCDLMGHLRILPATSTIAVLISLMILYNNAPGSINIRHESMSHDVFLYSFQSICCIYGGTDQAFNN